MKIFTETMTNDEAGRAAAPPPLPGTITARFGRETVRIAPEPEEREAPSRGAPVAMADASASLGELHVVVQNGRQFQDHHPDVPVLHDRGRFLLVRLDRERARELARDNVTCFGVMPLAPGAVVFDVPAPAVARAAVPFVQQLVDRATVAGIEVTIRELTAFPSRNSTTSGFTKASALVRKRLKDLGYQVRLASITVNGKKSRNVIAEKPGLGAEPRGVLIATAHLDSINLQGGSAAAAPGADDNASGSAGVIEIGRAFATHRGVHDLRLILFGGEEQGLFGSTQYVAGLSAPERARIRGVINMDMIANVSAVRHTVLLEGAPLSQSIIDKLSASAATYTQLAVETSLNPFNSDHVPFIDAQIPAVLSIEGADDTNGSVHSANDTVDKLELALAHEIVRMNIGYLAEEIGAAP
jgi:hypothetical protein